MIRFLTTEALERHPKLADGMFRDRAVQFRGRLGWPVQVDDAGRERDQYDPLPAVYIVWQMPDGTHGGSMRAMPTAGRTMAAEHFADICGGAIRDPGIWECTRLALAPGAPRHVAPALMLGGQVFGLALGLARAVGVFDAPMTRIYARLGWPPEVLGRRGDARTGIGAGLWDFSPEIMDRLAARSGVAAADAQDWFERDMGRPATAIPAMSAAAISGQVRPALAA